MRVVRSLPLNLIDIDRLPFERVLDLAIHLRSGGSVPPIHVISCPNGRFSILDGRHRFHAHKLVGRTHILARYGQRDDLLPVRP